MPDLLQINGPHGPIASCGSACYNSVFDSCACICKGLNHSAGYKKALAHSLKFIKHLQIVEPNLILSPFLKLLLLESSQTKLEI